MVGGARVPIRREGGAWERKYKDALDAASDDGGGDARRGEAELESAETAAKIRTTRRRRRRRGDAPPTRLGAMDPAATR